MVRWYRDRIAEPRTDDEVYGYWLFVFGVLLGILGIMLFLSSEVGTASFAREAGGALAGIALVLLMVGPVIRLPLARSATYVSYAGALVSFAGVTWFLLAYPGWQPQSEAILTVYAFGLVLIAAGAVLIPVVRGTPTVPDAPAAGPEEPTAEEETVAPADEATEEPDAAAGAEPESQARFELFEDRGGKWRWRLRHRNGNIIADSSQGYSSRQKAQQGLDSVKRNSAGAEVVRQEVEAEADDPEDPAVEPYPPGESQGTFEVFEDAAGEFRWRLVHDNGEIVADSGEGYADEDGATEAVERVQGHVGNAEYLRADPTAFEVYEDAGGKWRWRLLHRNGNIIGDSGEGYASRSGARDGIERVRETVGADAFEVFEDAAGEFRWRLRASNDEIIADGGEGYSSKRAAEDAVERVREYAPDAHALDYGGPVFELYEDAAMEVRWRLVHPNGEVMGDGGEGYASRTGARNGIDSVKRNAPNAAVELDSDDGDAGDGNSEA